MSPDRAKAAIERQADVYVDAVRRNELNASAVEGLLRADARHFADDAAAEAVVFSHGFAVFWREVMPKTIDPVNFLNVGRAIGGPIDGMELSGQALRINIPIPHDPDDFGKCMWEDPSILSPFRTHVVGHYDWLGGVWIYGGSNDQQGLWKDEAV